MYMPPLKEKDALKFFIEQKITYAKHGDKELYMKFRRRGLEKTPVMIFYVKKGESTYWADDLPSAIKTFNSL